MRKKVLSVLLSTAMVASLLAGCGNAGAENGGSDATDTADATDTTDTADASDAQGGDITGEITVLTNRTDLVDTDFAEYKAIVIFNTFSTSRI